MHRHDEPDRSGVGPQGDPRADERIREDVINRLTGASGIGATVIDVSVSRGEVTLAGTVENDDAKRRAQDLAQAAPGVVQVRSDLRAGHEAWQGSVTGPGAPAQAGMVEALESTSMVLGKTPLPPDRRD